MSIRSNASLFAIRALMGAAIAIPYLAAPSFAPWAQNAPPRIAAGQVEARLSAEGVNYEIVDGKAFKVEQGGGRTQVDTLYEPGYYDRNYVRDGGRVFRVDPNSGQRFAVYTDFRENFDGLQSIRQVIGPQRGWTSITLQSPRAASVASYNRLRDNIMRGRSGFMDNRIDISSKIARSGQSLYCYSVPQSRSMQTAKASIETGLIHFVKGDTIYFSGWYYLERGMPLGILDFESSYISESPGLRLLFDPSGRPRVELKWGLKPTFQAQEGQRLRAGRWTNVRAEIRLSDESNGRVQVWLDNDKVIDGTGQTLPLAGMVLDRLEVGVTANTAGQTTGLYIDELRVSQTKFF
jgi:hypothetical protein